MGGFTELRARTAPSLMGSGLSRLPEVFFTRGFIGGFGSSFFCIPARIEALLVGFMSKTWRWLQDWLRAIPFHHVRTSPFSDEGSFACFSRWIMCP